MPSEKQYLIALSSIPELGPARIKKLLEHFGSAEKIWHSSKKEMSMVDGIGERIELKVSEQRQTDPSDIPLEFNDGAKVISLFDRDYPKKLLNIYDPPPVLYVKGCILPEDGTAVAVVGTRRPTRYGIEMTKDLVKGLVEAGITIVSGLAMGIDAAAHEAALEEGGRTIAVLGTGVKKIYPCCNRNLADRIKESGALLSEYYEVKEIEKWTFPRRNRIISGLSLGTLVIEGTSDSGSLITAGFALEQNRDVFAVPGQIDRELSKAPNSLIKQGAKLVEKAEDILEELNIARLKRSKRTAGAVQPDLSPVENRIINCVCDAPKNIDNICAELNIGTRDLSPIITGLLMKGRLSETPGRCFYQKS